MSGKLRSDRPFCPNPPAPCRKLCPPPTLNRLAIPQHGRFQGIYSPPHKALGDGEPEGLPRLGLAAIGAILSLLTKAYCLIADDVCGAAPSKMISFAPEVPPTTPDGW